MTEPEYRQDDIERGYCPTCGRTLTGLMVDGRGFCDEHGKQDADWNGRLAADKRAGLGIEDGE